MRSFGAMGPIVSLVVGREGFSARSYQSGQLLDAEVALHRVRGLDLKPGLADLGDRDDLDFLGDQAGRFDRQIRFLGPGGQDILKSLQVLVVGAGGTGSHLLLQLAQMGVGSIVVFDEDVVEESNLNRLAMAGSSSVGRLKVDVAKEYIEALGHDTHVVAVPTRFDPDHPAVARSAVLFGCVDMESARQTLNETSVRYLVPYLDFASGIFLDSEGQGVRDLLGQVRLVMPGLTRCLVCRNDIDAAEAQRETMTQQEKQQWSRAGYLLDQPEVATPAVTSLNALVVSAGLLEFLKMVGGYMEPSQRLWYTARESSLISIESVRNPRCPLCGWGGVLGLADQEAMLELGDPPALDSHLEEWLAGKSARNQEERPEIE
jgi:molybdopterin/thiamine biosynthesis adenylyltransferase